MQREYVSLGAARQVRVMPSESWGSSRRGNFSRHLVAFEMRLSRTLTENSVSPMGAPRSSKPLDAALGIETGMDENSTGAHNSHLLCLTLRPRCKPLEVMNSRALSKESSSPAQIPSSRYQQLRVRPGTSDLRDSTRECGVTAKMRGPSGSPC